MGGDHLPGEAFGRRPAKGMVGTYSLKSRFLRAKAPRNDNRGLITLFLVLSLVLSLVIPSAFRREELLFLDLSFRRDLARRNLLLGSTLPSLSRPG